ncbi:hypothetical protein NLG97_g5461 [Lecanicillium saksenae]|uniref:Uncharacterized protein n=1 Tax=Lecanicillium saksenae TaxID=468837 RepID=A0ACC1QUZ2_9HYPO|nr:hypothetical protein NLG97_g5461 [Lecanicillium saksenae]
MRATTHSPSTGVESRVATLLSKLPKGEEDWDSKVPSPSKLVDQARLLLLPEATPQTCIRDIYTMYMQRIKEVQKLNQDCSIDLLKTLVLGTGQVLLQDHISRQSESLSLHEAASQVCEGVRLCFRAAGSTSALDDKTLTDYMASAGRAIDVIHHLKVQWTRRADELPLHVGIYSMVLCCKSRAAGPYITTMISRNAYRPQKEWDSDNVSIPHLLHQNLGERFTENLRLAWCRTGTRGARATSRLLAPRNLQQDELGFMKCREQHHTIAVFGMESCAWFQPPTPFDWGGQQLDIRPFPKPIGAFQLDEEVRRLRHGSALILAPTTANYVVW